MNFSYTAYTGTGKVKKGVVEAACYSDAQAAVCKLGLYPTSITESRSVAVSATLRSGVSVREKALFTRRLATLVNSSVPLFDALSTLIEQESNKNLRGILVGVRDRVSEGAPLARSLAAFPGTFSAEYCSMVSAGESSGSLAVILVRLADFLEDQEQLRRHAVNALIYPALMAVVGCGVVVFLVSFVVPKITVVFTQNHGTLPLPTLLLLRLSSGLRKSWHFLLAGALFLSFAYRKAVVSPRVARRKDVFLLRLPVVGEMMRNYILARFSRMLGLLLSGGVPIMRALDIAAAVLPSVNFQEALRVSRDAVGEGKSLSATLGNRKLFPPLLVHMVAVGEKNGQLDKMLETVGVTLENDFRTSVTRVVALIEPAIILIMGCVVGFIVVAILLPIFNLNELIR